MNPVIINQLEKIVSPSGILTTIEDRAVYSYDSTFLEGMPQVVVLPQSTGQVAEIVKIAARERIPIITRGMGSGLAGGSVPVQGGIVLCTTRMDRILEFDQKNATILVQSGVVTADLQNHVAKSGFYYPPDPSSVRHSTIGGNIACNAGGPHCLKYGVTGDYVLGLTAVMADGEILKTGTKVIKDVAGYDLKSLLTGSEGTLAIITEALLKVIAGRKFVETALVEFSSLDDAGQAVYEILHAGLLPSTIELMDQTALECIEKAMKIGLPTGVAAVLIIETDGVDQEATRREMESVASVCRQFSGANITIAIDDTQREHLWKARRSVSPSLGRLAPNKLGEDISVPRDTIPEAVRRIRQISAKNGLPIVIYGHAGDGNLHPNILFDKRDPVQMATVDQMVAEIFEVALDLGGSITGEHGVGILKKPFLHKALGDVSINLQKRIKNAFDPLNILNPGKIFSDDI